MDTFGPNGVSYVEFHQQAVHRAGVPQRNYQTPRLSPDGKVSLSESKMDPRRTSGYKELLYLPGLGEYAVVSFTPVPSCVPLSHPLRTGETDPQEVNARGAGLSLSPAPPLGCAKNRSSKLNVFVAQRGNIPRICFSLRPGIHGRSGAR
jgi:hypothetical protein